MARRGAVNAGFAGRLDNIRLLLRFWMPIV
jgi:hypothetical protein